MPRGSERSEITDRIVALWEEGKTTGEIAVAINDPTVTRRFVSNRLCNLGLTAHRNPDVTAQRKDRVDVALRTCAAPGCANVVQRLHGDSPFRYGRRTTCGPECRKAHRRQLAIARSKERARGLRPPAAAPKHRRIDPHPPSPGQIDEFLRTRGVTRCPTKFSAPTEQAALSGDDATKALSRVKVVEGNDWQRRRERHFAVLAAEAEAIARA